MGTQAVIFNVIRMRYTSYDQYEADMDNMKASNKEKRESNRVPIKNKSKNGK